MDATELARRGMKKRAPDHSSFARPRDVVEHSDLPADEKRRILLDGLQDELALLVADDEGMVGHLLPRPEQCWRRFSPSLRRRTPGAALRGRPGEQRRGRGVTTRRAEAWWLGAARDCDL